MFAFGDQITFIVIIVGIMTNSFEHVFRIWLSKYRIMYLQSMRVILHLINTSFSWNWFPVFKNLPGLYINRQRFLSVTVIVMLPSCQSDSAKHWLYL